MAAATSTCFKCGSGFPFEAYVVAHDQQFGQGGYMVGAGGGVEGGGAWEGGGGGGGGGRGVGGGGGWRGRACCALWRDVGQVT